MMLAIPDILRPDELERVRELVARGDWIDGNATSGAQSALAKHNRQLPEDSPVAREAGTVVLDALGRSALFVAAALPHRVYPPLFNRYGPGEAFGEHVDSAIRIRRGSDFRIRTDLSATLFLADPDDYDGGELVAGDQPGVRLPAGHLILYAASTLHHVTPVTRGERIACFFWVQSMVRGDADRAMLLELDHAIQTLAAERGQSDREIVRLTSVYHNFLRRIAEI